MTNEDHLDPKLVWRRRITWTAIALIIIGGGYFASRPIYREIKRWRAHRFDAEGEKLAAQNSLQQAIVQAQLAYQLSPQDTRTIRLMARLYTQIGHDHALGFWKQLLANSDSTDADRFEMVMLALRTRQFPAAREQLEVALKQTPPSVATLQLTSDFFAVQGDAEQSVQYARQAYARDNANSTNKMFLARRLLSLNQTNVITEAKSLFWQVARTKDAIALDALYLLSTQVPESEVEFSECAQLLAAHPNRRLVHEFLALDILLRVDSKKRKEIIVNAVKRFTALGDEASVELGRWLNRNQEYITVAETFTLSAALKNRDLFGVYLDSLAALGRWADVEAAINSKNAPLEKYFSDLYRLRAVKEQGREQLVPLLWSQVHRTAANSPQQLLHLGQYAEKIGSHDEAIKAYRRLTEIPASARDGWIALVRVTQLTGHTRDVRAVLQEMVQRLPNETAAKNDLAYLNLLLNENVAASKATGEQLYTQSPNMLAHRVTLSLAHLRLKDPAAAAALYKDIKIDWNTISQPGWLAVYAAILAANGEMDAARQFAHQIPTKQLKPEERGLIQPLL